MSHQHNDNEIEGLLHYHPEKDNALGGKGVWVAEFYRGPGEGPVSCQVDFCPWCGKPLPTEADRKKGG